MKSIKRIFLIVVLTFLLTTTSAVFLSCKEKSDKKTQQTESKLEFSLTGDKSGYEVSLGSFDGKELEIPSTHNGKNIVRIKTGGFENNDTLEKVVIPETVTTIEKRAFYECKSLKEVVIPSSVTVIKSYAFYGCNNLESLTVPVITISYTTRPGESNTNFFLGYLFGARNKSENGNYVPTSLQNVSIESATEIPSNAFKNCKSLKKITLGEKLTKVNDNAFDGCDEIVDIVFNGSIEKWFKLEGISNLTKIGKTNKNLYINNEIFTDLNLTDKEISSIPSYAFYSFSLKTVSSTGNVKSIGSYAFYNTSLESVNLTESLTSIGSNSFSSCKNLKTVFIGDNVTDISTNAFSDCYSLLNLTIGKSVENIEENAFSNCYSLTNVTIPASVSEIGENAFSGCPLVYTTENGSYYLGNDENPYMWLFKTDFGSDSDKRETVNVNAKTKYIYSSAFTSTDNITKIYFGGTLDEWTQINGLINLTAVNQPKSLYVNSALVTEVNVTDTTEICQYAFFKNPSITSANIGGNVKSVNLNAFYGCENLTVVKIGDDVTNIASSAFSGCKALTEITLPFTGESLNAYTKNFGFIFGAGSYSSNGGNVPQTLKKVILTKETKILENVFYGCTFIEEIILPDTLTTLNAKAFTNCKALKFTEENNACYLGTASNPYLWFVKAKNADVTSYTINSETENIADHAFFECTNVTQIILGEKVKNINENAFYGCNSVNYNEYDNAFYLGTTSNPYLWLIKFNSNSNATYCVVHNDNEYIWEKALTNTYNLVYIVVNGIAIYL